MNEGTKKQTSSLTSPKGVGRTGTKPRECSGPSEAPPLVQSQGPGVLEPPDARGGWETRWSGAGRRQRRRHYSLPRRESWVGRTHYPEGPEARMTSGPEGWFVD